METEAGYHEWKELIGQGVQTVDLSRNVDSHVENLACWIGVGMVVTERFDAQNREQRLLKELWDRSTESEQRMLAVLLKRIADDDTGHQGPTTRGEKPYPRPIFPLNGYGPAM